MVVDTKIKILGGIVVLGIAGIIGTMIWQQRMTSVEAQFGTPETWQIYTNGANNLSFRHPSAFEVIAPANFETTPFSVVKQGERGSSVLIQFGTIRREHRFTSTQAFVADYEQRFSGKRRTFQQHEWDVDGRRGMTLLQEEANGRLIGETFFFDPAVTDPPRVLGDIPEGEVREISLQLPARASLGNQKLYTDLYLTMLETVSFLHDINPDVPSGIPPAWPMFSSGKAGFSVAVPTDWELVQSGERNGMQEYLFASRDAEENNNGAEYRLSALPPGQSTALAGFMTEAFVQPFRDAAEEGTLSEEQLEMPGVGEAISLEGVFPLPNIPDVSVLQTLLVIVGGDETAQPGRGYVLHGMLPDGKGRQPRLEQVQAMTRSFRLVSGD